MGGDATPAGGLGVGTRDKVSLAEELRSDLRAVAGHELRTPLTSLTGALDTLIGQWDRLGESERLVLAHLAQRAARRLQSVADTLQAMTNPSTPLGAAPAPVPLRALLIDVLVDLGIEGVEVSCPEGVAVLATPGHVAQIVTNLVTNAFRYGAPPFRVKVEEGDGAVRIAVEDEGPGVGEELMGRMFDRYQRGTDDDESPGLGLAIVRALAEANGGSVAYQPRTTGARFVITLPTV